jgi:hypothetical protein
MSLIDKVFLKEQWLDARIQNLTDPINVRGVGDTTHQCNTFAVLDLYIPGKTASGKVTTALITRVVDKLKAKVLMGMDIIGPERMSANVDTKLLTIGSYKGIVVLNSVTSKLNSKIWWAIRSCGKMTIQPHALT